MRILWQSVAPWIPTGYGVQTALFAPRLKALGHDVALSCYVGLEGKIGTWNGMTVYPGDLTKFNKRMLRSYVKRHAGDGPTDDVLVLTLQDVWPWLEPRFGGIADYKGLRLASWCPVDHDPCPPLVVGALKEFGSRPIAMSRFGEDRLQKAGLDPLYVPHGVDTKAMRPGDDRDEIRRAMGIPADRFVVGMVANNQGQLMSRKCFPQVFQAFAMFQEKHPDAFLYLHTDVLGLNVGINLIDLAKTFGIPESAVGSVNQEKLWLGEIGAQQLGRVYAAMDVLMNPSLGEGFGVPIVEAQACGTPVIVTDWTSMPELVGAGWLVDGDPWWHHDQNVWWKMPAIKELIDALGLAYEARGDMGIREKARAFAVQYDVDRVTEEFWVPALAALDGPREVPPLRPIGPNRAARRKAEKAERAAA
ncbi:MAG TPA: glycosyltransferase family 4 protein [Gemmatimonadota bacterium]|nr:glycosyltransferase family 4 protein [Gemmatimonadota bacterium]